MSYIEVVLRATRARPLLGAHVPTADTSPTGTAAAPDDDDDVDVDDSDDAGGRGSAIGCS